MDSCSNVQCNMSTVVEIKRAMAKYCLNTMRKRTVDEQLGDFSVILKDSLDLSIVYRKTGLEVSYGVGSLSTSVNGMDESTCVRQCKREFLHKLQVFCQYTNRTTWSSVCRPTRSDENSSSTTYNDVYSEIELCKKRVTGKTAANPSQGIVLVDPEMDIPRVDSMDGNESPLKMKISYFPTEWEITFDIGLHSVSTKGSVTSPCMRLSKSTLLDELSKFVQNAESAVDHEAADQEDKLRDLRDDEKSHGSRISLSSDCSSVNTVEFKQSPQVTCIVESWNDMVTSFQENNIGRNDLNDAIKRCYPSKKTSKPAVESVTQLPRTPDPVAVVSTMLLVPRSSDQPTRSLEVPDAYEKNLCHSASVVLLNITWATFGMSTKRFFDILVQTNRANRSYLNVITNCIVSNAIDKPEYCPVYASLCCYVIQKAWEDSRATAADEGLSRAFKRALIRSCRDVLTESGAWPGMETDRRAPTARQSQRFDLKARDRTHGTCRLMGEVFVRGQLFKTVMETVNTFLQTHDAHMLECLCVLLIIIGPKLERTLDAPGRLYAQLENHWIEGYLDSTKPLPRHTMHMMEIVLNTRECRTTSNARRRVSAERETAVEGDRRRQAHRRGVNQRSANRRIR